MTSTYADDQHLEYKGLTGADERPLPPAPDSFSRLPVSWPPGKATEFYTSPDPRNDTASWRPYPLRTPYLIVLSCFSLVFLLAIEILRQTSNRNHGLAFFSHDDELSGVLKFGCGYVPAIVAVVLIVLFTFTELDVLRLEPYFQLSKSTSAPATVLFTDYAFEHPFIVPITSIQRKHWNVVMVSSLYLVASILLPALQNSLIGVDQVKLATNMTSDSWPKLLNPQNQDQRLSVEVVGRVNNIFTNYSSLPPFTTSEYGVTPIDLDVLGESRPNDLTVEADLPVYWVDLFCTEALEFDTQPELQPNGSQYTTVDDDDNPTGPIIMTVVWNYTDMAIPNLSNTSSQCSINYSLVNSFTSDDPTTQSLDWAPILSDAGPWIAVDSPGFSAYTGGAYSRTGCNQLAFLATIITSQANTTNPVASGNATTLTSTGNETTLLIKDAGALNIEYASVINAFVCKPRYNTAIAHVTMLANGAVQNVLLNRNKGLISTLTDTRFNISSFQDTLTQTAVNPEKLAPSPKLPIYGSIGPEIMNYFPMPIDEISLHVSELARLISKNPDNVTMEDYLSGISRIYKQAFALSMKDIFDTGGQSTPIRITQKAQYIALTITPVAAIISEILLALLFLTFSTLVYYYWGRKSCLKSDPDSIASICSLIADLVPDHERSNILAMIRAPFSEGSIVEIVQEALDWTCRWQENGSSSQIEILTSKRRLPSRSLRCCNDTNIDVASRKSRKTEYYAKTKPEPKYLRLPWVALGFATILALSTAMATLLGLALRYHGFLFLTDSNSTSYQILWSFTPTIVVTLIGSCWTAIYRDQSVLEPWVKLHKGSNPKQSLLMDYASRPPITAFPRSIKNRDYIIGIIAAACVANIILNILVGGLFSPVSTELLTPFSTMFSNYEISSLPDANLTMGSSFIPFDLSYMLVRDYISGAADLLPWTTPEYSFVPITIPNNDSLPATLYSAVTAGIGVNLECEPYIPVDNVLTEDSTRNEPNGSMYYWNYTSIANDSIDCYADVSKAKAENGYFAQIIQLEDGKEFMWLNSTDDDFLSNFNKPQPCEDTIMIVEQWNTNVESIETNNNIIVLNCAPKITWQNFTVHFNQRGQVKKYMSNTDFLPTDALSTNATSFLHYFHTVFKVDAIVGRTRAPYDWPGLLIARMHQKNAPNTSLITTEALYNASKQVYSLTFSTYFSFNRDMFLQSSVEQIPALEGMVINNDLRMVPSIPHFATGIFILVFYTVAFVTVYLQRRARYKGPRIPNSIGTIIPWIIHSRMLKDFKGTHHLDSKRRAVYLTRLGKKYRFGKVMVKNQNEILALEQESRFQDE